jgi:DNA-binding response OmpR family regulator
VANSIEVLLIADNAADIALIRDALAGEPIPVTLFGEHAIQMLAARRFEPDLVILDLNIPTVSGLSFLECSQLDAPVVVFTSSSSPEDRRCAFELGAKEFVQKPNDLSEYMRRVSQIVRHWGRPGPTRTM